MRELAFTKRGQIYLEERLGLHTHVLIKPKRVGDKLLSSIYLSMPTVLY